MVTWINLKINSDERTINHLLVFGREYFDRIFPPEESKRIYIEKLNKNTMRVLTRTGYGLWQLPDGFIVDYSKKHPKSVIVTNYADEGMWGSEDDCYISSSIVVDGEKQYSTARNGYDDILSIHHSHDYDYKSGDPTCLDYHYGYIYKMVHPKLGLEYRGKREIKPTEKWRDYKGSSVLLNSTNKKLNISEFDKHLITLADDKADLELMEIKSISMLKAIDPERSLNIALGSTPRIRNLLYSRVFESEEDCRFSSKIPGALEKRVVLFFESLTPREYQELCYIVEEQL